MAHRHLVTELEDVVTQSSNLGAALTALNELDAARARPKAPRIRRSDRYAFPDSATRHRIDLLAGSG